MSRSRKPESLVSNFNHGFLTKFQKVQKWTENRLIVSLLFDDVMKVMMKKLFRKKIKIAGLIQKSHINNETVSHLFEAHNLIQMLCW